MTKDDRRERIIANVERLFAKPIAEGRVVMMSGKPDLGEVAEVASVPGVMSGDPVVVGTRVLGKTIVAEIKAGSSAIDILRYHPTLSNDAIMAVIEWHHANGGDPLWDTDAGRGMQRWLEVTSVTLPVAQALLDVYLLETMVSLINDPDTSMSGRVVDDRWMAPRREVMKLKKRVDAVVNVVADASLVGGPGIEAVIAWERRRWQDLVTNDDGTPALFETLARMTALVDDDGFLPRWNARSAFTPPNTMKLPLDLTIDWDRYARRWDTFKQRNPRVMIASLMSLISESHDHSSFPFGWEGKIKAWVDDGMPALYPFDNRNGLKLETLWMDMSDAITLAGPGWVEDRGDGRTGVELMWVQP
ncbi:MAG: hypothetical protein ABS76_26580 [Pelagibacterium sp. SCN 64-44]|nr:MAG: hypothetical protein ABS76_26580 [Pelagibacterium sp. SCN 64-44]